MQTSLDEPLEFLGIVGSKGFWNENTVQARRTACKKFFDILDEEQRNVEYVRDHLDVIKGRFMHLNKDAAGATVDEYGRRVKLVMDEFTEWKADRSGWEKKNAAKQTARPAGEGQKKPRVEKPTVQASIGANGGNGAGHDDQKPATRTVTFPLRPDFDLTIMLPRDGLTVDELKRLPYFLLPYARDWEPTQSPRGVFDMVERE